MIFEAVRDLIVAHNDCDPATVTMDTTFQELDIDSLATVEMVMDLEDTIGMEIELDRKVATVGDLVRFLEEKQAQQA